MWGVGCGVWGFIDFQFEFFVLNVIAPSQLGQATAHPNTKGNL
ncbi:hypothetical protein N44_02761 [Microcystis aeruginosa NIES-44]|uniref:Type IV pilin PilA n=1 Tax=Microcystis aeruginosa NIES-44 TaxID=449439 RepID=A0A0A1VY15_MICAE|nr:hypothetical protein N44_02761 [Microcystis aeruginosa NIES-44]